MHIWGHLFLTGEFPARADLLSGLTLEQVTLRPAGASHSIYEELWHAAAWGQSRERLAVEDDAAARLAVAAGSAATMGQFICGRRAR